MVSLFLPTPHWYSVKSSRVWYRADKSSFDVRSTFRIGAKPRTQMESSPTAAQSIPAGFSIPWISWAHRERYRFVVEYCMHHTCHSPLNSHLYFATLPPFLTNGSGILSRVTPQVTSFNHACKVFFCVYPVYVLSRSQFNSPF